MEDAVLRGHIVSFAAGAGCYATQRPRSWLRVFSFHEVFHTCTVAATYVALLGSLARG